MTAVILLLVAFAFSGCIPYDGTNDSSKDKRPEEKINVIQNGHVGEPTESERLVTPCCLTYRRYGMVVETEVLDDLSNTVFKEMDFNNNSERKYLVVNLQFTNVTGQDLTLSDNTLSVTADGVDCQQMANSFNTDKVILASHVETTLQCCYSIPTTYKELVIIHKKYVDLGSLEFYVGENGLFNEDDLDFIEKTYPLPQVDFDNEYIIPISYAESDSFYHSEKSNVDYKIENVFDGDCSTCWQDGSEGAGLDETLCFSFAASQVSEIRIINGSHKQNDSYIRNNRLSNILIEFSLNDSIVYETEMTFDDDELTEDVLILEQPIICDSVSIAIKSVYNGTEFDDTCISEISFVSPKYTPLGLILLNIIEPLDKQDAVETEPTGEVYTKENPRDIVGEDVPNLEVGQWIRVTGSADCYLTDDGKISIEKFSNLGKYGLLIAVPSSDGQRCYTLEAPSVNDYKFKGQFSEHAPDGTYYGYRIHFDCEVTVVGRVGSYIEYSDGTPYSYICMSSDSEITDLKFNK